MPRAERDTYTITELAEEFAVTSRTIRFYEDQRLLRPVRHGLNRVFSRRERARLKLILRGKRLGFSLARIREMLDLYDLRDGQGEQLRVTLAHVRARLADLRQQQRELEQMIAELDTAGVLIEEYLALSVDAGSAPSLKEFLRQRNFAVAAE